MVKLLTSIIVFMLVFGWQELSAQTPVVCAVMVERSCADIAGEIVPNDPCNDMPCYSEELCVAGEPAFETFSSDPLYWNIKHPTPSYPPGPGQLYVDQPSFVFCKLVMPCGYECRFIPDKGNRCFAMNSPGQEWNIPELLTSLGQPCEIEGID